LRVLVTGGLGFLGRVLTAALVEDGNEVIALTREQRGEAGVRVVEADLRDRDALARALAGTPVDAVAHLAARTGVRESFADPLGYYETNLGGTLNLLRVLSDPRLAGAGPVRLVFSSTSAVYGSDRPGVLGEHLTPQPQNPYAASKLAAEQVIGYHAATGAIGAITLRCFNIAGASDGVADPNPTRIISAALRAAARETPHVRINGDGSAVREFTHVRDAAEAFRLALAAVTAGVHQVLNLGTGEGVAMGDVVRIAERVTDRPIPVTYGPPASEAHTLIADNSRIRDTLGWRPIRSSIETIVDDMWSVMMAAGPR
jgi:UDP-glucose 4-epimerase